MPEDRFEKLEAKVDEIHVAVTQLVTTINIKEKQCETHTKDIGEVKRFVNGFNAIVGLVVVLGIIVTIYSNMLNISKAHTAVPQGVVSK